MRDKPESFEIQEYNDVREPYETYRVVKQIVQDRKDDVPVTSHTFRLDFVGDQMKVYYMSFEDMLPHRMQEVEKQAADAHKEFLRYLKKEFKKRVKHDLALVEQKDLADYTVQKVSINERYYFVSWKFYRVE